MENKTENFEYDEDVDSLYIYSDKSDKEDVAGSIVIGNLIFDVGNAGDFVGLEIDNASHVFNLSSQLLSDIESAKLTTFVQNNVITIAFAIRVGEKEYNFSYMVPKNKIALTT